MIEDNIRTLRERIERACKRCSRDPGEVTLLAVAKGRSTRQILEAFECGLKDIGENRVQEALLKYRELSADRSPRSTVDCGPLAIRWHMVGHLQRNKAKEAVRMFDLIHSVDSCKLAQELDRQAGRIGKVQDILVEVKTSFEESKYGLSLDQAPEAIKQMAGLDNLRIKGLMTIAPLSNDPLESRPYFRKLRVLRDKINELRITNYELRALSMGMSDDFEVAIEEGADIVRLGRAVFSDN